MGVWIETPQYPTRRLRQYVTPCMGVWIETRLKLRAEESVLRHTLYGCVD